MATTFTMIDVMNAALIEEGLNDVVTEGDGSDEWRLLSRQWPFIVESELESGRYSFTKAQANITSRVAGSFGYPDAYLTPSSALHVRKVWVVGSDGTTRYLLDWVQDGTKIHVDEDAGIWIEYLESADEAYWTANFARGVKLSLQASILRMREDHREADNREALARDAFSEARTISSQSRSAQPMIQRGRFATARFGRG